jgi:hypothetical protein
VLAGVRAIHGAPSLMRYFCVTHVPPPWPVPGFMEPVSPDPAGDGALEGLREYGALFSLRHLVQTPGDAGGSSPGESMVGISHHGRFAVTRAVGAEAADCHVVTPEELAALPEDCFVPPPGRIVVPAPTVMDESVLAQYGSVHAGRDLLHAVGIAIDQGVVEGRIAADFLNANVLIAAPTVGVYPTGWYLDVLTTLAAVAQEFADTVRSPNEGPPQQVPAPCLERLHSLLLQQLLATWPPELAVVEPVLAVAPHRSA